MYLSEIDQYYITIVTRDPGGFEDTKNGQKSLDTVS